MERQEESIGNAFFVPWNPRVLEALDEPDRVYIYIGFLKISEREVSAIIRTIGTPKQGFYS